MKPLEEMTDRELLNYFASFVKDYDYSRDEELYFIDEHPNSEFWSDEDDEEHNRIVTDIKQKYEMLDKLIKYIKNERN